MKTSRVQILINIFTLLMIVTGALYVSELKSDLKSAQMRAQMMDNRVVNANDKIADDTGLWAPYRDFSDEMMQAGVANIGLGQIIIARRNVSRDDGEFAIQELDALKREFADHIRDCKKFRNLRFICADEIADKRLKIEKVKVQGIWQYILYVDALNRDQSNYLCVIMNEQYHWAEECAQNDGQIRLPTLLGEQYEQ